MRKKALRKEFHTEIRKSLNRFLSIFFIVAMGVAFFAGIQAAAPDMRATGDYYYDQNKLMDIKVLGTLGLTDADIEALSEVEGVALAVGSYMEDVYCGSGDVQQVLHLESIPNGVNELSVKEGRLPDEPTECLLDATFAERQGYSIGDTLTVTVSSEEDTALRYRKFTVCGIGYSPCYIAFERGSTTLGNGSVSGFAYLLPEAFHSEVYHTAYLRVKGAEEEIAYTDAYDAKIEEVQERVEAIQDVRCELRYAEVKGEAQQKIDDAEKEVEDGKQEVADAEQELADGKAEAESELAEAESELTNGESELADGRQKLEDSRRELTDGEQEIADGEQQITENEAKLADARSQIAEAVAKLNDGEKEYRSGLTQYQSKEREANRQLSEAQKQIDDGAAQLESGKQQIEEQSARLSESAAALEQASGQLQASQEQYDTGMAQISQARKQYEEARTALLGQNAEYEKQQAACESGRAQYNTASAQLAQAQSAYQESLNTYEAAKAACDAAQTELDGKKARLSEVQQQITALTAQKAEAANAKSAYQQTLLALQQTLGEKQQILTEKTSAYDTAQAEADRLSQDPGASEETRAEANEKAAQCKAEVENASASVAAAQADVDTCNANIAGEEAKIQDADGKLPGLQQEETQLPDEIAAKEAEISQTVQALAEQKAKLDATKTELDAQQAALDGTKGQLDAGDAQLKGWKTQLVAAAAQLAETDSELSEKEAELAAAKTQLDAGLAELAAGQQQLQQGQEQLAAARQQLAEKEQELQEAQKQVDAGKKELTDAKSQLSTARQKLDLGWAELNASRAKLSSGEQQLNDAKSQLSEARQKLADGRQQIADGEKELAENEQKIADGWKDYEDGKQEAADKIADGEQKIADAKQQLADAEEKIADAKRQLGDLKEPKWYVYDRNELPDNTGYGENAERMTNIAQVFPLVFFLVAALISLTTMTRMVEEERTQIGTMKALGYGKKDIASKYLKYAFYATMGGSVFGVLVGEKIFPWVIINGYSIMYQYLPKILLPYDWGFGAAATVAALACTMAATFFACFRELHAVPAELMRPPAPKQGKRVLLEYVPFLWKHLSFTWKSTVRNLMRYKKRFLMTIIGIGGCMGLLLVGFGLRDSIMDVAILQFDELQLYDAMTVLDADAGTSEKEKAVQLLRQSDQVSASKRFAVEKKKVQAAGSKKEWTVYLYVPEDMEQLEDFFCFRDRTTKEEYQLTDEGAIVTEKIAKELKVGIGDTITLKDDEGGEAEVPVTAICENYLNHYIYLTPACYERAYKAAPEFNSVFYRTVDGLSEAEALGEQLLACDVVLNVTYTKSLKDQLDHMLGALDIVIIVLIISAGMLAFVVLYNLNNININERKRELATIKVLGFYDGEVAAYVYRENILLTIIGAAVGLFIGKFLHLFIIQTVEVDACMFGRNIKLLSYVLGTLFTFAFSIIVNLVMYYKLKKIDMVESLKSVE